MAPDAILFRTNAITLSRHLTPALTISYGNQPDNNTLNMRGIGTYSLGVGVETDVAVMVDDVPVAIQANAFKDLADVSRVEVLNGPQSTLFGKINGTAGKNFNAQFDVLQYLKGVNGSLAGLTGGLYQQFENGPCYNVINAASVSAVGGSCAVGFPRATLRVIWGCASILLFEC